MSTLGDWTITSNIYSNFIPWFLHHLSLVGSVTEQQAFKRDNLHHGIFFQFFFNFNFFFVMTLLVLSTVFSLPVSRLPEMQNTSGNVVLSLLLTLGPVTQFVYWIMPLFSNCWGFEWIFFLNGQKWFLRPRTHVIITSQLDILQPKHDNMLP